MASKPSKELVEVGKQPRPSPKPGTLAAIVGMAAAALLFTAIPKEESGRTVAVEVAPDGAATIHNLSGKQYLQAYLDIAKVPTACDGITKGVKIGQTYTEAQCTVLLERELVEHATAVMRCTPGLDPATEGPEIAAAVSLAYNIGAAGYCGSTAARRFNAGQNQAACDAFLSWDKARVAGVLRPVAGLSARRKRERALCLEGALK
jgi:lysozyme